MKKRRSQWLASMADGALSPNRAADTETKRIAAELQEQSSLAWEAAIDALSAARRRDARRVKKLALVADEAFRFCDYTEQALERIADEIQGSPSLALQAAENAIAAARRRAAKKNKK